MSGLFPDCHVVPRTTFNLVALGPYLDHRGSNHAVVLTATTALELENIDFDVVASACDPRLELIRQLQCIGTEGDYKVKINTIGTRAGPGSLYDTNLLNRQMPTDTRTKMVHSARTGIPLGALNSPDLLKRARAQLRTVLAPKSQQTASPQPTAIKIPNHAAQWTSSTSTEKALIELRYLHFSLGHPSNDVLLQALKDSPRPRHHQLRKYVKLMDVCNVCPMGSQTAESHPDSATTRASDFLARLILDCSGKQAVATMGGCWFFLLIVDDATRMKWVRLLKSVAPRKSQRSSTTSCVPL